MAYIKKQDSFSLRKFKGVGLASALLGSAFFVQGTAQAETRDYNIEGILGSISSNQQFGSGPVTYDGQVGEHTTGNIYNEQIKSIEKVSENGNKLRIRVTFKDGASIPNGGQIVLGLMGAISGDSTLYMNNQKVGRIKYGSIDAGPISNMRNIKNIDEYIQTFESINTVNQELSWVVLSFNSEFAKLNQNRVVEFELDRYEKTVEYISSGGNLNEFTDLVSTDGSHHDTVKLVDSVVFNPVDGRGFSVNQQRYDVSISKKDASLSYSLSASFNSQPSSRSGINSVIERVHYYTSAYLEDLNSNQIDERYLVKKDDLITFTIGENSVYNIREGLNVGDIVPGKLTSNYSRTYDSRFNNSSSYYQKLDSKPSVDKPVRLEIVSKTSTSVTYKVLDDVKGDGNHLTFEPDKTTFELSDTWLSKLTAAEIRALLTSSSRVPDGVDSDKIKLHYSLTRDGSTRSEGSSYLDIDPHSAFANGNASNGTVKVRYVDEKGAVIPNTSVETVIENQPWYTPATITPKEISGYTFVRSQEGLTTLAGSGERTIDLVYKQAAPKFKYVEDPDKEPTYRHEQPPTSPGEPTVVTIGTKPTKKVTEQPYRVTYEADKTKDANTKTTKVKGKIGTTTVTTTYTINQTTGEVEPHEGQPEVVPPVDEIIQVGTKPKVDTKTTPMTTIYKRDDTKDFGSTPVETPGHDGSVVTTTPYTLDSDGNAVAGEPTTTTTDMVPKTVTVGTKPKVVVVPKTIKSEFIPDETKPKGYRELETPGSDGSITTTTPYDVDDQGNVTEGTPKVDTVEPKAATYRVGIKPEEVTETIPVTTQYIPDETHEKGWTEIVDQGSEGHKTTTTTYYVSPYGYATPHEPVVNETPMKPKIIKVGVKPVETTQTIAAKVVYEADPTKDKGQTEVVKPGKDGTIVTKIPYVLKPNGDVVEGAPVVTNGTMEPKVIKVGTKPKVVEEEIPFTTVYEHDDSKANGEEEIVNPGKVGHKTTTTSYILRPDGTVIDGTPDVKETPMEPRVIKTGSKPKVDQKDIPVTTKYEPDDTRDKGTPNVEVPGKAGYIRTTTPYTQGPDGKLVPGTPVVDKVDMVPTVIKVGTKPTVTTTTTPIETRYERDDSVDKGVTTVVSSGSEGITTTTIKHKLNDDGNVTDEAPVVDKKDMTPRVIKVGTKPKVDVQTIPATVKYEFDPNKGDGEPEIINPGRDGRVTTTTPYVLNPDGTVTDGKPVVDKVDMVPKVVKVGNKPHVDVKDIPVETIYEPDDSVDVGVTTVIEPGKPGKVTTTTPLVQGPDGKMVPGEPKVDKVDMTPRRVKVGTKPKVISEDIPVITRYERDDNNDVGKKTVVNPGKPGKVTTTTPYVVGKDGHVTPGTPNVNKVDMVPRVVKVGTKPKVSVEEIPVVTKEVPDPSLDKGKTQIVDQGKPGRVTTTIPVVLNPDGSVSDGKPVVTKVDMTPRVVKVGTKSKDTNDNGGNKNQPKPIEPLVDTKDIHVVTVYQPDDTLDKGKISVVDNGTPGRVVTTTPRTQMPDGSVVNGQPTVHKIDMKPKVVKVGTKPLVDEKVIPINTVYKPVSGSDIGSRKVIDDGQEGRVTTTTTYRVDGKGQVIANEPVVNRVEMRPRVVEVVVGEKTNTKVIPAPVRYEKDPNRDKGLGSVKTPGRDGSITTITKYELDPKTGEVIPKEGQPVEIQAVPSVVKVPAKDKVDVSEIPIETEYVDDANLFEGQEVVEKDGKVGRVTTTITYDVNPETGEVTEGKPVIDTIPMEKRIVRRGTKSNKVNIQVHHYLDGTNTEVAPSQTLNGEIGKDYQTSPVAVPDKVEKVDGKTRTTHYELVKTPDNAKGVATKDDTVNYYYKAIVSEKDDVVHRDTHDEKPANRQSASISSDHDTTPKSEASAPKSLPKTGDSNLMSLMAILMTMTGAVTVPRRKRKHND